MGTVDIAGHFVFIGVSALGRVLFGGQFEPVPNDGLNARYFRTSVTGAVDLGTFMVNRVP